METKKKRKMYLSGKITGTTDWRERFAEAENKLKDTYTIMNPARINGEMPEDTTHEEYMIISFDLLRMCDCIYMMEGWEDSKGARMEYAKAKEWNLDIFFQKKGTNS